MKTKRTELKRSPSRGSYTPEAIFEVLQKGFLCHVGFVDRTCPFVIPTAYGFDEKYLYLHGSSRSRMLEIIGSGGDCCITITHLDALVVARSVFHHSMNFESLVILGKGELVTGETEQMRVLELITENILPGRWAESRLPNKGEMKATSVVRIPIKEASLKVRTGPPKDDRADYDLDIWAGLLPYGEERLVPQVDPELKESMDFPASVQNWLNSNSQT